MAYLLLVEQQERRVLVDRQAAATLTAFGARDPNEPLPDVGVERARLDQALNAEPPKPTAMTEADRAQQQLRRVLGVDR